MNKLYRSSLTCFATLFFILSLFVIFPKTSAAQDTNFRGGKLRVVINDDFKNGRHKLEHFLDIQGRRYTLHFPRGKTPRNLRGEVRVNVRGKRVDSKNIVVSAQPGSFQTLDAATTADANIGGVRHAIMLKIQSDSAVSSASTAQLSSVMSQVSARYIESSYGIFDMKNDRDGNGVADIFTVTVAGSSAAKTDTFTWCNNAVANARTQLSIDPSLWNHVLCILPPDMSYTYFGTAYVPGSMAVINGNYAGSYHDGYVHELGHNLGLGHSNSPTTEYADSTCIMGGPANNRRKDFNGPKKMELSWVQSTSASSGRYILNAIEAQPSARVSSNSLLKLRDPVTSENLYVSYRAPAGTVATGLAGQFMTSVYSFPGGTAKSILLASLGDGQSFSRNGISVSQASHTDVSATVDIGTMCVRRPPTVSLSPARVVSNGNGAFTVSVTNNDIGCADSSTFAMSAAGSGASLALGSASISLAEGQTGATSLAASASAVGTFPLSVSASESAHGGGSAAATFVFDNVAPNAISTLRGLVKKNQVSLSWTAPFDTGSKVVSYRIFRGATQVGSPSSTTFNDRPGRGTHTYTAYSLDEAGNWSGVSNAITVALSR